MEIQAQKREYQRRNPESTPCYQIVLEHLDSFIQAREVEGRPLPQYVKDEFDAYLKCGILAYGFLRLKCNCCMEEKVVAFSCKKRGFCPSCAGKRMAEAGSHLVDNILPFAPYRQFVISFPITLRFWLNGNRKLYSKVHRIITRSVSEYYESKAISLGIKNPKSASVSFTQRWGSSLNLNPHIHLLALNGVYTEVNGEPKLKVLPAISDEETSTLIETIASRTIKLLRKENYLDEDCTLIQLPELDELFQENESLRKATEASISGRIAFGPNAGKRVTRIGSSFGYEEEIPLAKGKRCYSLNGFSIHANRSIRTHARKKLEELIQYMARGPLSNERLEIRADGKIKLKLKSKWSDGTSHLLFTPHEYLEKLTALIPPPRTHMTRWQGAFAPASPIRQKIVLNPKKKKAFQFKEDEKEKSLNSSSWAKMLARVFKIDVTKCEHCGGNLYPVSAVIDPSQTSRYLKHMGLPHLPPEKPPNISQPTLELAE